MRTLAATATVCVGLGAAAAWFLLAPEPERQVITLSNPSTGPIPGPADGGTASMVGLDKFKAAETPSPVADLAFTDGQGNATDLGAFKGRVVLLNLWATWCAPCVKEMPALDRLQAQLGGPGFEVVALSLDRGGKEQVDPFYEKTGINNLKRYYDTPSASMRALTLRGLPTTLLIDAQGRELGRIEGAVEWDSPEVVEFLRKRMG
nr:TlpA disulfide reductase family protein [Azospirillum sp. SYSU D00513]